MTFKLDEFVITDEALADLRAAKSLGWNVLQKFGAGGECANCGGWGFLLFGFQPGYSGEGKRRASWHIDGKLESVEVRAYPCPICNREACVDRAAELWATSGLSDAEYGFRLDWLEGKGKDNAVSEARALLAMTPAPKGWQVYYGDYGYGKSGILKSMTAAFIRANVQAFYCRANDILTTLRGCYGNNGDEQAVMARFRSYAFLAVDEVDRISDTAWAQSALMAILDDRYNLRRQKATAIATNLNPSHLPANFGYLADRMLDSDRIPVGGAKLRGE